MKKVTGLVLIIVTGILFQACSSGDDYPPKFLYLKPTYNEISLQITGDSVKLPLAEAALNSISSFNYFTQDNTLYLSVYDDKSAYITIYTFPEGKIIKVIPVKKWLAGTKLDAPSVYVRNFDSIIVCTRNSIALFDSSSKVKNSIPVKGKQKFGFDNTTPGNVINGLLYVNNLKAIPENSVKAQRSFHPLGEFNLATLKETQVYHFSEPYRHNIYGYSFHKYGYCFNNKGNFVFSFPADTNIYETNLMGFHQSYFAKSKFQQGDINPITEQDIENDQSFFEYSKRDSYGPIFFDPARKRYLRLAKQKLADSVVFAKNRNRKRTFLIFDENFKIIGEGPTPEKIDLYSLFITPDGRIYARGDSNDKPYLNFLRLEYAPSKDTTLLSKK